MVLARRVIEEMSLLANGDGSCFLSFCHRIKAPVFTLLPPGYGNGLRVDLDHQWGKTSAEKIERVLRESEAAIKSRRFSRVRKWGEPSWEEFEKSDLKFIDTLKN